MVGQLATIRLCLIDLSFQSQSEPCAALTRVLLRDCLDRPVRKLSTR